ncbi:MAG: archaeal flagellar protein FlaI [Candidatus Micrarchaeota archaeon]|nr:MAG: archaeal flagellar protein FlaI [Candidatus Micrarchaeota archaeon]
MDLPDNLLDIEDRILDAIKGRLTGLKPEERSELIRNLCYSIDPNLSKDEIKLIEEDIIDFGFVRPLLNDEHIEDIMINNTQNIFVYDNRTGNKKIGQRFKDQKELIRFIKKMEAYNTSEYNNGQILDIHLPNGSRANVVASPLGYNVTIRNSKPKPFSILDLVNYGELDYGLAAKLWMYTDGFNVRPANILIGGMPASGKTTLLNAMFSFFRPEERIITIEETYELNTETHENCVRLETNNELRLVDLVKASLRMRPDMLIIGEVRGEEAIDMMTAMNIGKNCMATIHASSARDVIKRLQHAPMNVPYDILPAIDAIVIVAPTYDKGKMHRRIVQVAEIAGLEMNQVLLSDIYTFDYKTKKASLIMPGVTYRDLLSEVLGITPQEFLEEEQVRAAILARCNELHKTDMKSISDVVKAYYIDPYATIKELGMQGVEPVIVR